MLVGLIAGILTTGCWVPQVVKSIRSRKVEHFSWIYLIAASTGISLWFAYGVMKSDVEIWLANGLSCLAVLVLLGLKLHVTVEEIASKRVSSPGSVEPIKVPVS